MECELPNIDFSWWASQFSSYLDIELSDKDYDWEFKRNESLLDDFKEIRKKLLAALSCSLNDFIIEATEEKCPAKKDFKKLFDSGKFITFNYSKILEDIYSIADDRILHIHGAAKQRLITRDDYEYGTLYAEVPIIFGHDKGLISEDEDAENDIFNPHRIMDAVSNDLRKDYKIKPFEKFVKRCNPLEIEIIGHGFGKVDFPYFKKLNEIISDTATIVYWLYDENELENTKAKLKKFFKNKKIHIRNYGGDALY